MKRICVTLILIFSLVKVSFSQQGTDTALQHQSYVFNEFVEGTVLMKSHEVNQAPLNYCSYDQTILFKSGGQTMTLTGLEGVDTVYIADKKIIPVGDKMYEILDGKGSVQLCVSYVSKLVPWVATTDHYGTSMKKSGEAYNTVSSVYVMRPYKGDYSIQVTKKYWLKSYNNLYKANNVKDFLKVFKEDINPSIGEYVQQNNIDFNKENDLITLVDFCNSKQK